MLKGIGIDIIEIDRVKEAIEKHGEAFLSKIFTEKELKYCRGLKSFKFPELAVRFAAKEAYSKAIGTGIAGIGWKKVEVVNDKRGKPELMIKGKKSTKVHISLSHSRDQAIAIVYVEK